MTPEPIEADRLRALASYEVMDTPPEPGFDGLARIAALLCETPTALVTLVDDTRQFFKAREGFDGPPAAPLDVGFCPIAVRTGAPLVIHDTLAEGYSDNPAVSEGGVRFYAGMPLRTAEGTVLGTLCVFDTQPRPDGLTPAQEEALRRLADQVVDQIDLRRALADRERLRIERRTAAEDRRAVNQTQDAIATSGGDLDAILAALVAGAMQAVPAAEGGVMELRDGEELEYRAVGGSLAPHRGVRVPLDGSTSGACARSGQPILLSDALTDPRVKADLRAIIDLRSGVHAPVTRGGRVHGVLKLQSSRPDAFTERDLEVVGVFAGLAAMGLTEASEVAALRAVQASEARYRAVFESAIDYAIIVLDLQGNVIDWNEGATRILGWAPDEICGKPADVFFTPEDRDAGIAGMEMHSALTVGRGIDERWHLRKSGERFWANGEMMALRDVDTDGAVVGYVKILRDRTEERRQVEALRDQRELLQTITDHVAQAVFQMDAGGVVTFANPTAEAMFGWPAADLIGCNLHEVLHHSRPDGTPFPAAECQFVQALRHGRSILDREDTFFRRDGTPVRVLATNAPVHAGGVVVSAVLTISDITERRQAETRQAALLMLGDRLRDLHTVPEMTAVAAEIVGRTLGAKRAAFGLVDAVAGTVVIEPDWTAEGWASIAGRHRFADYGDFLQTLLEGVPVSVADVAQDPRTAADVPRWSAIGAASLINVPVRDRDATVAIYLVHDDRPRCWTDAEIAFVKAVADRCDVGVARVRAEEHQRLLNHELSHRMKNLLAMVQSIATQTMRGAADVETAKEVLAGRLIALGKAHDLLMGGALASTRMEPVIRSALMVHADRPERFRLTGPELEIGPDRALSLALALTMHELATNAAKYGALTTEDGYVDLRWEILDRDGEPQLSLVWTEVGGPPVTAPERKGFGSRFIERGLAAQVGGELALAYPPTGVTCRITAPLAAFQAAATADA